MIGSTTNELVINFHITEKCNFNCKYCYAHWTAARELHQGKSKDLETLIIKLAEYFIKDQSSYHQKKSKKIRLNFAGGEPLLLGEKFLSAYILAHSLGFETSLITNGYFLSTSVMEKILPITSILGLSIDSADDQSALIIGRSDKKGNTLSNQRALDICKNFRKLNPNGLLKINTVITNENHHENLGSLIKDINPNKWKILRTLAVYESSTSLVPSQNDFFEYIKRHSLYSEIISVEDNDDMQHSYLMINPSGCFYQNKKIGFGYNYSRPILEVGVEQAFQDIEFNLESFKKRYKA